MEYGYFDSEITGYEDTTGLPIFDRAQNAAFMAEMFSTIWGNGVCATPSTNLQVKPRTDGKFGVTVQAGKCWIKGRFGYQTEDLNIALETAETDKDRTDSIIVELNLDNREMQIKVVTGTPELVKLIRKDNIYQIRLAQVKVEKNVTQIPTTKIKDVRSDPNQCGYVSGVIKQVDTTTLFEQYNDKMKELDALMRQLMLNPPEGLMLQSVYDKDNDGIADNAAMLNGKAESALSVATAANATKLNGQAASYYAKVSDIPSFGVHDFPAQENMNYSGSVACKFGNMIFVQLRAQYGTGSTNGIQTGVIFAHLPAAYKPRAAYYVPGLGYTAARTAPSNIQVLVDTDGTLKSSYLNGQGPFQMITANFAVPSA